MDIAYLKLEGEDDSLPDNKFYRQAVGALLHLATSTCPDIAVADMSVIQVKETGMQ